MTLREGCAVLAVINPRRVSYDHDWRDALRETFGAREVAMHEPDADAVQRADVVVMLHSTNAGDAYDLPGWLVSALESRRGRLVWFMANEFRDVAEKRAWCERLGADFIASMLPIDAARLLYGQRAVAMPHALNDAVFRPTTPRADRTICIGYRGTRYPDGLGDQDRRRIIAMASRVRGSDVREGGRWMLDRVGWASALNTWRATVSTESGARGAKCLSSRHLDAIGTKTVQIMPVGRFNDVLGPEHYIACDLDAGLREPLRRAEDEGDTIAERALDHVLGAHTYRHRMRELAALLDSPPC